MLSLLGKPVPLGLKVFLTALAIVDDLGAVLVIAFFYTSALNLTALFVSLGFFALALLAGRLKVTGLGIYLLIGALMWYFTLESGVSPTAGFLGGIGFTMSLFVAALGFANAPVLLDQAKLGVLASSVVAAVIGLWVIGWAARRNPGAEQSPPVQSVNEGLGSDRGERSDPPQSLERKT